MTDLSVGTEAWWDPASRTVTCLACLGTTGSGATDQPIDPGEAGASALREYQRRHDAREQHARDVLGGAGALLAKVLDEPQSTRAWKRGGNGEVRVAASLEKLLEGTGVQLLHDRHVPGHGRKNIDVGPGGATVIDSKTHRGRIRKDWAGGLFIDRHTILRIDGRDQTKLIAGIEKQIGYVRTALTTLDDAGGIEIKGAICFPNVDGLPLFRRIEIRDILVDGPKRVAKLAARPGLLEPDAVHQIWVHLAGAMPSA